MHLYEDTRFYDLEYLKSLDHSQKMTMAEVLPILISPDSGKQLSMVDNERILSDGIVSYPIYNGLPYLYPHAILQEFIKKRLELRYYTDPIKQYYLLSQLKQSGEINAPFDSIYSQRHFFRMHNFLKSCTGTVLDVGCDNVKVSAALFSNECKYIGLDPFSNDVSNFRVIGTGECLPFLSESLDNVVFNTSLDHILDYHSAIDEAHRVLKPGGSLYIATLLWKTKATLLSDSVHFHHFREYEIVGALQEKMSIIETRKYRYKEDSHRFGFYVLACKMD